MEYRIYIDSLDLAGSVWIKEWSIRCRIRVSCSCGNGSAFVLIGVGVRGIASAQSAAARLVCLERLGPEHMLLRRG